MPLSRQASVARFIIVATATSLMACSPPAPAPGAQTSNQSTAPKRKAEKDGAGAGDRAGDADQTSRAPSKVGPGTNTSDGALTGDDPTIGGPTMSGPAASGKTSTFDCSGLGIAAFADKLAEAAQRSCTSDGPGVITNTNYPCLKVPIETLAPPFPSAAFARVENWAKNGNSFSGRTTLLQCVEFAFLVTAAVCGQPFNGGDATIFDAMDIPGWAWMAANQAEPQPGDILMVEPAHVAITASVLGGGMIRIAEANFLTLGGAMTSGEDTGLISNTRTDSVNGDMITGWYRRK
jgi:hypothetical protein